MIFTPLRAGQTIDQFNPRRVLLWDPNMRMMPLISRDIDRDIINFAFGEMNTPLSSTQTMQGVPIKATNSFARPRMGRKSMRQNSQSRGSACCYIAKNWKQIEGGLGKKKHHGNIMRQILQKKIWTHLQSTSRVDTDLSWDKSETWSIVPDYFVTRRFNQEYLQKY